MSGYETPDEPFVFEPPPVGDPIPPYPESGPYAQHPTSIINDGPAGPPDAGQAPYRLGSTGYLATGGMERVEIVIGNDTADWLDLVVPSGNRDEQSPAADYGEQPPLRRHDPDPDGLGTAEYSQQTRHPAGDSDETADDEPRTDSSGGVPPGGGDGPPPPGGSDEAPVPGEPEDGAAGGESGDVSGPGEGVTISPDGIRRHELIIGGTGGGKTRLIRTLAEKIAALSEDGDREPMAEVVKAYKKMSGTDKIGDTAGSPEKNNLDAGGGPANIGEGTDDGVAPSGEPPHSGPIEHGSDEGQEPRELVTTTTDQDPSPASEAAPDKSVTPDAASVKPDFFDAEAVRRAEEALVDNPNDLGRTIAAAVEARAARLDLALPRNPADYIRGMIGLVTNPNSPINPVLRDAIQENLTKWGVPLPGENPNASNNMQGPENLAEASGAAPTGTAAASRNPY